MIEGLLPESAARARKAKSGKPVISATDRPGFQLLAYSQHYLHPENSF
jgi:hypothetical protein